jgi:hypothetical protein
MMQWFSLLSSWLMVWVAETFITIMSVNSKKNVESGLLLAKIVGEFFGAN